VNSLALAQDYLRKVKVRRRALQILFEGESYADVVRESQEVVELILKGVLRFLGIDPPKRHDIGGTFRELSERLPANFRARLDAIEFISKTLFEERGHAFYGDEASLTPPSELFGEEDARRVMGWVDELLALFDDLVSQASPPEGAEAHPSIPSPRVGEDQLHLPSPPAGDAAPYLPSPPAGEGEGEGDEDNKPPRV
jgi:HEPN domain-containing protein